jgi:hypothetical protein
MSFVSAGNWETMRFLLSNARWWMDEYKLNSPSPHLTLSSNVM